MKPEDWIEGRVVQFRHMTHVASNRNVNRVMNIFKGGFSAGRACIPHVIAESVEVFVVRIIHKNVDVLL